MDAGAGRRHDRALDLLERALRGQIGFLTLQALGEFFVVTTRKFSVPIADADRFIESWVTEFDIASAGLPELREASAACRLHGLQFWDAMLWAAARSGGASYLISEDLQDGRVLGGVRFINPFNPANDSDIDRLLPARSKQ